MEEDNLALTAQLQVNQPETRPPSNAEVTRPKNLKQLITVESLDGFDIPGPALLDSQTQAVLEKYTSSLNK